MARKSSPKSLVVCPVTSSSRPGAVTVSENSDGSAFVVTIKVLVGAPKEFKSKKGKTFTQSGVLTIGDTIEIGGVLHRITLNSGWYEGRRVGDAEIVVKPVTESAKVETATEEIPF